VPLTCQISINNVSTEGYIDNSLSGGIPKPTMSPSSSNSVCLPSNCGTLDISSTSNPMTFDYEITYKIGGSTGNAIRFFTSNKHKINITCIAITMPTDNSTFTQYANTLSNHFTVPGFAGGVGPLSYTVSGEDAAFLIAA